MGAYEDWALPIAIISLIIIVLAYLGWRYSKPKEKRLRKLNVYGTKDGR